MKFGSEESQRPLPTPGMHVARLVEVIGKGTTVSKKYGKKSNNVQLTFEIVDEKAVFNEEKGEQPFALRVTYTQNLGDEASLRKMLTSWNGKDVVPTKEDRNAFSFVPYLNRTAMVNVIHKPKASNPAIMQASIGGVMPVMAGIKVPSAVNEFRLFDMDPDGVNILGCTREKTEKGTTRVNMLKATAEEVYAALPEFLQKDIAESFEFRERWPKGIKVAKAAAAVAGEEEEDQGGEVPY